MSAVPSTRCRGSFRGVMLETSVIRSFISWKLASNSESRYFVIVSSTVHIACSIESISTSSPCKVNDSCSSSARGSRTCSGKLLVKTDYSRAEDDPGYYTVLKQHSHLSTSIPPPSTRMARSRVVRSSPSLTTRAAAELMGIDYNTSSLRRSRKRPLVTLTRNLRQETDVFYKIYCKSHYSVNKL